MWNIFERRYIIGGVGSGNYKHKGRTKKGIFKIFGLTTHDLDYYFYVGTTSNYLTKIKHFYIYQAKSGKMKDNLLFKKIVELDYKFDIVELEILSEDHTFQDAKLYLQSAYLDKFESECNASTYCFCNKKSDRKQWMSDERKNELLELYKLGESTKTLGEKYGHTSKEINYYLRSLGWGKTQQLHYEKELERKKQEDHYLIKDPSEVTKSGSN